MSYFNKKSFTMRQVIGLLTIVFLGIAAITYAVSFTDFTSGSTISSSEMNTKLNALKDAINMRYTLNCSGNNANDIMVRVGILCVDKYEASVWSNIDGTGTQYGASSDNYPCDDTGNNCTVANPIYAVSKAGVTPSRYITWFQAQQACAFSRKRLLTNAEWQMAAAGTPDDTNCNVNSGNVANTGANAGCTSNYYVNDMVGNVWEWVGDWMQGNTTPWAPSTGTAGTGYGGDLMYGTNPAQWQGTNSANMPAALIRGGGYGDGTGAGVFALYASDAPSGSGSGVGFRCAR